MTSALPLRGPPVAALGFLLAAAAVIAVSGFHPVFPKNDDGWFFLISYAWRNGLGLTNPWGSPVPTPVFDWHGFLQPMLVGALAPCGRLCCFMGGLVALQLGFLLVWTLAVAQLAEGALTTLVLCGFGLVATLQYSARPELLAATWMTLGVLGFAALSGRPLLRAAALGLLGGLTLMTDPVPGVMAILAGAGAIVIAAPAEDGARGVALQTAAAGLAAALTVLICLTVIYPYGASIWIDGMRRHGAFIADRTDSGAFLRYYAAARYLPLLALMFLPLAIVIARAVQTASRRSPLTLAAAGTGAVLFCLVLMLTAVRIPAAYYNFSAMTPLIGLLAVRLTRPGRPVARRLVLTSLGIVVLGGLAAFALAAGERVRFAADYARQKAEIAALVRDAQAHGRHVAMDPPLIPAVDDIAVLRRVHLLFMGQPEKRSVWPADADVLLRAQSEFGVLKPSARGGRLLLDRFDHSPLDRFFHPESLAYAVFVRAPGKAR